MQPDRRQHPFIFILKKNVLTSIASLRDVMRNSGYYGSRDSRHYALVRKSPMAIKIMGCVPIFRGVPLGFYQPSSMLLGKPVPNRDVLGRLGNSYPAEMAL